MTTPSEKQNTTPPKQKKYSEKKPPTLHQKIWKFLKGKIAVNSGEKGGDGKTYHARMLLSYLLALCQGEQLIVYDCDRSNPTLWLYYHTVLEILTSISFTENRAHNTLGDELVEQMVGGTSPLLLDSPSQFFRAFSNAYFDCGLRDSAEIYQFSFLFFYVSSCDSQSVSQFTKVLDHLGTDYISWVLVKNLFRSTKEDWEELLQDKSVTTALKKHKVVHMYIPELKRPEITMIEKAKLPFDKAIELANLCAKTRLRKYQQQVFAEFDSAFLSLMEQQEHQ